MHTDSWKREMSLFTNEFRPYAQMRMPFITFNQYYSQRESAQGMASMYSFFTISNLPNTRYLFLLSNGLVKQATKSTHFMSDIPGHRKTVS